MKRFACVAVVCLVATLGFGSAALAQTPPAAAEKIYVELNAGPTLGHKSDKFVGGEFGVQLIPGLFVIAEASHMGNVGTTDLDDRAAIIANCPCVGGTATTAFKVNHGAAGLRYNIDLSSMAPKVRPYVMGAIGAASVKTEVEFAVNGTVIDPATRGVQLGGDLSGTQTKPILVLGFGVNVPFMTQFFVDLGYRYGQIFANTSNFETDKSIPTHRIVFGVGYRF